MLNSIRQKHLNKIDMHSTGITADQLSHELRISLTGILGANYLLGQTNLDEQQHAFLKLMDASAKRLLALADNIA